jgi:hypothetical protein
MHIEIEVAMTVAYHTNHNMPWPHFVQLRKQEKQENQVRPAHDER